MSLNWSAEAIFNLVLGAWILLFCIVRINLHKTQRLMPLAFIRLAFLNMGIFMLMEGVAFLTLNTMINALEPLPLCFSCIFMVIAFNLATRDDVLSWILIPFSCAGIACLILAFQPGASIIVVENGAFETAWTGLLEILGFGLFFFVGIALGLVWGILVVKNAPYEIQREARIFLTGLTIGTVGAFGFQTVEFWYPVFIFPADLTALVGGTIMLTTLISQPKLLYILPFSLDRLFVRDRGGNIIFSYDWSRTPARDLLFAKYIDSVQKSGEQLMNVGGLVNIQLEQGVLTIVHRPNISVGLMASRSSRQFKDAITKFSIEFESMFSEPLAAGTTVRSAYDGADLLVKKFFSNFPSRLITGKKQSLVLHHDRTSLPPDIEKKLHSIFPDPGEFERVKEDLIKSPTCVPTEFLELYDEIGEELNEREGTGDDKKENTGSTGIQGSMP